MSQPKPEVEHFFVSVGRRVDRHVVIDRRITQGTRSEAGQRYNERMWTAIATCKKQKKSFFEFLLKSIKAKLEDNQAPTFFA